MGKQRLIPYLMAQITEEVTRFIFLIMLPMTSNPVILAKLTILSMSVGKLGSSLHMFLAILFRRRLSFEFMIDPIDKKVYQQLLMVTLPMTMMFNAELANQTAMVNQFTLLNSYILPIITPPSFATVMISNWTLPSFSASFAQNNKKKMQLIFNYTCGFALLIDVMWSALLYFSPEFILQLFYKQTHF